MTKRERHEKDFRDAVIFWFESYPLSDEDEQHQWEKLKQAAREFVRAEKMKGGTK